MVLNFLNPLYARNDDELLRDFGAMLKQRRINANLTQQELAGAVGLSKDQLSKIERTGKTTLATLVALSRKLGLLEPLLDVFKTPELTPMQKYEIEQKTAGLKIKRQRVKK